MKYKKTKHEKNLVNDPIKVFINYFMKMIIKFVCFAYLLNKERI